MHERMALVDNRLRAAEIRCMPAGIHNLKRVVACTGSDFVRIALDPLAISTYGPPLFHDMVEIGSCFGGTVWLYSQLFAAPNAIFVIVDIKIDPVLFTKEKYIAELKKAKGIK